MPRDSFASSDKQSEFSNIVSSYLESLLDKTDGIPELEIRFGTRGNQPTTKQNFDNVIQKLLASGFGFSKKNAYSLKIQNEYLDSRTGQTKLSLIRAEIHGINDVQKYCKTNMPDDKYVLFTQKMYARKPGSGAGGGGGIGGGEATPRQDTSIHPVIFDDFNFKVSYQREKRIANTSTLARSILKTWNDNKKTFRYINRSTMTHPDLPFQVDLSVVKESQRDRTGYISASTFDASKVLESPIRYEIEIEVNNELVGPGTSFTHPKYLLDTIRRVIKMVLSGIQETNYPVSSAELRMIQRRYYTLIHPDEAEAEAGGGRGRRGDSSSESSDSETEEERHERDPHKKADMKEKRRHAKELASSDAAATGGTGILRPRHFIGPSSFTLQMYNVRPLSQDSKVPNIRMNYSVTEKADGQRKLLFVAPKTGRIYLIDMNMNVQFTGAVSLNSKLHNTLIDGEHIVHNKKGDFINLYLAFDVYYVHKADIRARLFYPINEDEVLTNFRLPLLVSVVKNLQAKCVSGGAESLSPIRIEHKHFEVASSSSSSSSSGSGSQKTIFDGCASILRKCAEHQFEYHTDGLIFTPLDCGVGSNTRNDGNAGPLYKTTWNYSFKWKPADMNTIDFLVTTKKGDDNEDLVSNVFKSGLDMSRSVQIQQYKTLVLRVGYDERKHGYINPCVSVIEGQAPPSHGHGHGGGGGGGEESSAAAASSATGDSYKPAPFYPTYPYDNEAHICNIMLRPDEAGVSQMMTIENDIIQDETIVEFSYDETKPVNWRWVPLRVRHDKTAEYRAGGKNYGNAYHVANSNWHSIHNAITPEMIMTGEDIPDELVNDDVYYNHSASGGGGGGGAGGAGGGYDIGGGAKIKTLTKSLRDFHNLYVKRKLILSVAKPGNTLIDFAVGKGGDLPKWIAAKLGFVFGIDYSKDNLEHKFDGVCARYLDIKKTKHNVPAAIFIHGDSSKEMRTGQAAISERYRLITRAIFGEGAKDASLLGRGVYPHYGRAADGFDICSVQFAIHYFFENILKLHTFLQNVSECTKLGGYFIGTCFDGVRIFQALSRLENGGEISVMEGAGSAAAAAATGSDVEPRKIWSVTKKYHQAEFEPDSSSIGYEIEVFQESINKNTREYLVNFEYLTQLLENYGFDLVSPEEAATTLTFPMRDGTDTFDGMFHEMEVECKQKQSSQQQSQQCRNEYGSALFMRPEEKQISFYNRYFIFRKNRNINAKHLKSSFLTYAGLQEEQDRGMAGTAGAAAVLDESTEKIALDKIARASVPIDVASKPAIAAHIIRSRGEEAVAAATAAAGTGAAVRKTIKVKPKPTTAAAAKKAEEEAAAAAAAAAAEGAAAPIEQIEKSIKKRTKKATIIEDTPVPPAPPAAAAAAAAVKASRKKTEKTAATAAAATAPAAAEKKKTKKKAAGDE
jgi:hypothetical protein